MKKILTSIIILVMMVLPIGVFAAGSVGVSPSSLEIEVGQTKKITITVSNVIGDVGITSSNTSVATVSKSSWDYLFTESEVEDGLTTKTYEITVTGVSEGTATITLNFDYASLDGGGDLTATKTVTVTVKRTSTNNNLASLKVDDDSVPDFSPSTTSYSVSTGNASVNITATPEDTNGARVSGTGRKNLNIGTNKYEIKVTAESGAVKTYILTITRIDNRSTNNNLASLKVDNASVPNFSPTKTIYTVETSNEVVNISATPEDTKATVASTNLGNKTLKYGTNKFEIKVTAENGGVKTYTLNINRIDNRSSNNNLATLTIDKGNIVFDKNKTSFEVKVDSNVEKVTISATTEDEKATIASGALGLKEIKYGSNKFEIKVTAENGNLKTYKLTIVRDDPRDTNNFLLELSTDNAKIPFNKNITSYSVNVENDIEKVLISATPESEKSTVSGTGEKKLKEGENRFEITVTAENQSVKIYTLTITRLKKGQVPEEYNYLKSLTIEGVDLEFDQSIVEYTLSLTDQDSLNFIYELEEGVLASIEGNENLKNGSVITLTVSKDTNSRKYTFNIVKEDVEEPPVTTSKKGGKSWIIFAIGGGLILLLLILLLLLKKKKSKEEEEVPETPTPDLGYDNMTYNVGNQANGYDPSQFNNVEPMNDNVNTNTTNNTGFISNDTNMNNQPNVNNGSEDIERFDNF